MTDASYAAKEGYLRSTSEATRFLIYVPVWSAERYIARALATALSQDYPRELFRVVCVVDAAPDGTWTEAKRMLAPHGARVLEPRPEEYERVARAGEPDGDVALMNPYHVGVVGNTWKLCAALARPDEVVVELDGDDQLAHRGVLRRLAEAYADPETWMTYGSYASDEESRNPDPAVDPRGIAAPIDPANHTRRDGWKSTHLKTWRAWLFGKVRRADLCMIEDPETWLDAAADHFMMWPMIEMAGAAHARYLHEVHYLKNDANPLCSHKYQQPRNLAAANWARRQPAYLPLASPADEPRKEGE